MAEATVHHDALRAHIQAAITIIADELGIDQFKPARDRVLCKPMEKEYVAKVGLLYVVEDDEKRARFNLVVAVGADVKDVAVGDVIITGRYVGHPIEYNGEAFRLFPEADVLGVYHDPDN